MSAQTSNAFGGGLILAVTTALLTTALAAQPKPADAQGRTQVAVVFPPWFSAEDAFTHTAAAGGLPVRSGLIHTVIVAAFDDQQTIAAVRDQGAWFVMDPIMRGDCAANTVSTNTRGPIPR